MSPQTEDRTAPSAQRPLELILARNLLTNLSTPALLTDGSATVVFYNEAAAQLLGRSFEDTGKMSPDQWTSTFGPLDEAGSPLPVEGLPITQALRDGRPAHGEFRIRTATGIAAPIEASAVPIIGSERGSSGAMILFWPLDGNGVEG